MPNRASFWTASRLAGAVALLLSAFYLLPQLNRNWVPHDEGILSQSAERIVEGQIPHRDYNEPYTGGLAYLDSLAFRFFGTKLMSLRYMLFLFFLAWVPAIYAIASDFVSPWPAAAITLLAVVWSVPNYTAAMPSWYCLFFSTFGAWAVLRYLRNPRVRWLILAGASGGLAFLMKSPGLFYAAGVMLFLVYREQSLSEDAKHSGPFRVLTPYFFLVLTGLLLFLALLTKVTMTVGGGPEFFHFVLPALAIVAMLLVREFRFAHLPPVARVKLLAKMLSPFLVGLATPLSLLFFWYWRNGAAHDLVNALVVLQLRRVAEAQHSPPPAELALLTFVWVVVLTEKAANATRPSLKWSKIVFATIVLLAAAKVRIFYLMVYESFAGAVPVLVLAVALSQLRLSRTAALAASRNDSSMLLLFVTAMCSLIQFPFSTPLYFCYIAPLVLLTLVAFLSRLGNTSQLNWKIAGSFAGIFAVFMFPFSFVLTFQSPTPSSRKLALLEPARAGGLRVLAAEAEAYNLLIPFVMQQARGAPIIAGPDCPEVYFLTGYRNYSRSLFAFLEEPAQFEVETAALLRDNPAIKVAVVRQHPQFSITQRNILTKLVRNRFPMSRQIGDFIVYWRN